MPPLRIVIVSVVALHAVGCGWQPKHASTVAASSIFQPDYRWGEQVPQPERPPEIVPVSAIDDLPNVDTFTIEFRTYDAKLPTTGSSSSLYPTVSASQSVTIVTDAGKDEDGLLEGSVHSEGGRPGSSLLKALFTRPPPYELIVDDPIRLGPHKVAVRLRTSTYTKPGIFISESGGINWSVTVTIDGEYSQPKFHLVGGWSGAHAAELEINGALVYRDEAVVLSTSPSPSDDSKKESKKDSDSWSWTSLLSSPKRSVTSDRINRSGLLPKPEYRL
jgi:hypothetical protein